MVGRCRNCFLRLVVLGNFWVSSFLDSSVLGMVVVCLKIRGLVVLGLKILGLVVLGVKILGMVVLGFKLLEFGRSRFENSRTGCSRIGRF